jgi:hypothetical protein
MRNYVTFEEAAHAFAHGATIWNEIGGKRAEANLWDIPKEGFQDASERNKAARCIARVLRRSIRMEDSSLRFFIE